MNILKDMELFVRVVHCDGLAAAGRELGMTPSSVTIRIKNLEEHYQVKLLTRTTRSISLTDSGREFYQDSLRMLDEVNQVESKLITSQNVISGPLRITATSDFGRQHIAPLIEKFVIKHPDVQPFLNINDSITDLAENNIDIAVRYGAPTHTQLITHKLGDGYRVLCASPEYLAKAGVPKTPDELADHACLTMVHVRTPRSTWYFDTAKGERSISIEPARSCDDGAMVRQWALEGAGIALKSVWDVANDLKSKKLVTVLDDFNPDYQSKKLGIGSDLYLAYADRKYLPNRTIEFIKELKNYFSEFTLPTMSVREHR